MRQQLMNPARLASCLTALLVIGAALFTGVSCNKADPNAERAEYIRVYASPDAEEGAATSLVIGVREGVYPVYMRTNVSLEKLQFEWQDDATSPWVSVSEVVQSEDEQGLYIIYLKAKARSSYAYYTRRSGVLMVSAPELSLGAFIPVYQGCTARFSNDCSNFKYGVVNPLFSDWEKDYSSWSTTQKGYFLSEPFADGEYYLYGRNTNLKLGDDQGHGACIITPYVDAMRSDSLLMVSFRAVAYADASGRDNNKITVDIIGGGVFRDDPEADVRSIELEVPHFDYSDASFPNNMWNDGEFMLFVRSSDRYPITSNTQIRITAGSLNEASAVNNRVFVRNVYIRRLVDGVDEDYFEENGGSGVDHILGLVSTTETE